MIPFTSADGSAQRADVELLRRPSRRAAARRPPRSPRRRAVAATSASSSSAVGASDSRAQRLRQQAVRPGEHRVEAAHQHVDRVERRAAVHPGVQVALAGPHLDVEADEAAGRELDRRDVDAAASRRRRSRRRRRRARPASTQSAIVWPPISSSPSNAKRRLTGSAPASTSRCAALRTSRAGPCRRRRRARTPTRPGSSSSNGSDSHSSSGAGGWTSKWL